MPETVTDTTFAAEVLASEVPVLVDFWAQWCPHCLRLAPVLDELATEYAGRIRFVKLDVDENPTTTMAYGALSLPTLTVFRAGERVSQLIGAQPRARLRAQLDEALSTQPLTTP